MKKCRKALGYLLLLSMLVFICPMVVRAETTVVDSGNCGDNLTWSYDSTGMLTISGAGSGTSSFDDYEDDLPPWYDYRKSITSVKFTGNILDIGDGAFYGCTNLKTVEIPNGVASIGACAFESCSNLSSIIIPGSVRSISKYAFSDCTSLTNVYFGGSQEQWNSVGKSTYGNDALLNAKINYSETYVPSGSCGDDLTWVLSDSVLTISGSGEMAKYAVSTAAPWYYCRNEIVKVIIKNGVTSIGEYAFKSCSNLKSIQMPNSISRIGNDAFDNCTSLEEIEIPQSVSQIEESVFSDCTGLEKIEIPVGITEITSGLFGGCTKLSSVTIPDTVISIGTYAFSGCSSLTNIELPKNVVSIGKYAFQNCSSLTQIEIPDAVVSIEEGLFKGCKALTSFAFPDGTQTMGGHLFNGCSSLISIVIPDGIKEIEQYTFAGCSSLKSIEIPLSVKTVDSNAFSVTTNNLNVYYSGTEEQWNAVNISSYGNHMLKYGIMHYQWGSNPAKITIGNTHNAAGGTVNLTVSIDDLLVSNNVTSVDVEYDENNFDFVSGTSNLDGVTVTKNDVGVLRIDWSQSSVTTDKINLKVTVTLKASSVISMGEYPIAIKDKYSIWTYQDGKVRIVGIGDANGDGKISVKDSVLIRQFLAGIDATEADAAMDVNHDGKVSVKDAVYIRQYLAGIIPEL